MDDKLRTQKIDTVLKQFESLPPGPPFVRCVIFEWQDDGQQEGFPSSPVVRRKVVERTETTCQEKIVVSGGDVFEAMSRHPVVKTAVRFRQIRLGSPWIVDDEGEFIRHQGYPDSPRFSKDLLWCVNWLLDPIDALGVLAYRDRVDALNRIACNILNCDGIGGWDNGYSALRLVSEIIQRLDSRRQVWVDLQPISRVRLWQCETSAEGHPFATVIDDFVSDSKIVLQQIAADAANALTIATNKDPEVPSCASSPAAPPFIVNNFQRQILQALKGRALTKQALADEVCGGDGARIYRKDGINELKQAGKVSHKTRLGYFRLDAPPPENAVN